MRPAHKIPAPGPMLATGSGPKRRWHVFDARAPKRDTWEASTRPALIAAGKRQRTAPRAG